MNRSLQLVPSIHATRGQVIIAPHDDWMVVHPLDHIALSAQSIDERLERAIAWILGQAIARLNELEAAL